MKLHRNLVAAVINGLKDVFFEKKQADQVVEYLLSSNKNWGSRDRNFIADNIYTLIRYKRLYEFCSDTTADAEDALWKMLGSKLIIEEVPLTDWSEFAALNQSEILQRYREAHTIRKVRESIPDWLDELGEKELGDNWGRELKALNTRAPLSIRVNTLKSNKETVKRLLANDGIDGNDSEEAPDALIITGRKNFKNYPAYKGGLFEIQDVSSQLVAPFLDAKPEMLVIDGCAGAGGKTLHISALMENKGEILAIDVNEKKLEQLQNRAARAGSLIIRTIPADKMTVGTQTKLLSSVDRILLDVPCSGLGVLRRKPDAKWSLSPKFIQELLLKQAAILDEYAPMLKSGGLLVYSTCSILPSENERQIEKFLARQNGRFELLLERKISPSLSGFDGFYMAKLKKIS